MHRTLLGDGIATAVAGFFGGVPNIQYGTFSLAGIGLAALVGISLNLILPNTKIET